MEAIKKTILRALTTGHTMTGGTIIIPDLTKSYFFKICFVQEAHDFGFFDAYVEPVEPEPPTPPVPVETFYYIDTDNAVFTDTDGTSFSYE